MKTIADISFEMCTETITEYVRQNSCFGKKKYNFQLFCNLSVKNTAFLRSKKKKKL